MVGADNSRDLADQCVDVGRYTETATATTGCFSEDTFPRIVVREKQHERK